MVLGIYWQAAEAALRREVCDLLDQAARQATCERAACGLQAALRRLGLLDVQIMRLILARYLHHASAGDPAPAHAVVLQVIATLRALRRPRGKD